MMNFTNKHVARVMRAVRNVTPTGVEVRDVAVAMGVDGGMSFRLDTIEGVNERDMAAVEAFLDAGENIVLRVRTPAGVLVAEVSLQNPAADMAAMWFAVMANRSGHGYWLDLFEVEE